MKNLKSARRLVSVALVALALIGANRFLANNPQAYQRPAGYQTATEIIQDKDWNWGLAFVVAYNHGSVSLKHLGSLETNGIYIPAELGLINNLKLDSVNLPITLNASQTYRLYAPGDTKVELSKTRCLNRLVKYCDVRILTNSKVNDKPTDFVAVFFAKDIYGLVEQKLLETAIGPVN